MEGLKLSVPARAEGVANLTQNKVTITHSFHCNWLEMLSVKEFQHSSTDLAVYSRRIFSG